MIKSQRKIFLPNYSRCNLVSVGPDSSRLTYRADAKSKFWSALLSTRDRSVDLVARTLAKSRQS